jgi:ABC-type sugar transport system ATPase subunit
MALVGENGAGKSTLIKILAGALRQDTGDISLDGHSVTILDPKHSKDLGVSVIYQELELAEHLSIAENIFVGQKILNAFKLVDFKEMYARSIKILHELKIDLDPHVKVSTLSIAKKQMVEIARAISTNARIIVMDEPTSSLPSAGASEVDDEVEILMKLVERLRDRGISVIYISHRMDEIFRISDRITVLRDGKNVGIRMTSETNQDEIVSMMVGRDLKEFFGKGNTAKAGKTVLSVSGIPQNRDNTGNELKLEISQGEIVGLAGLIGAGRTELALDIMGAVTNRLKSLKVSINGEQVFIKNPKEAVEFGLGYVPEDRKLKGLFLRMAIKDNISAVILKSISTLGFTNHHQEKEIAKSFVEKLRIRTESIQKKSMHLSGGNQQKVVLAKWLAAKPDILILDEPTRGVDVGAKSEIYNFMYEMAEKGMAVLMISSELPEILGVSDRIYVMREGLLMGCLDKKNASQEKIMALATATHGGNGHDK